MDEVVSRSHLTEFRRCLYNVVGSRSEAEISKHLDQISSSTMTKAVHDSTEQRLELHRSPRATLINCDRDKRVTGGPLVS